MALCGHFALARRVLADAYDRSVEDPRLRAVAVYSRAALNCLEDRFQLEAIIDRIEAEFPNRR